MAAGGAKQRHHHDGGDEEMEEHAEGVHLHGAGERSDRTVTRCVDDAELPQRESASGEGSEDCDPAQQAARLARSEARVGHHDQHRGEGENDLGKNCDQVRRH